MPNNHKVIQLVMIHRNSYERNKSIGLKTRVRFDRIGIASREYVPTNASLDRISHLAERDYIIPSFIWARNSGRFDGDFVIAFSRKH